MDGETYGEKRVKRPKRSCACPAQSRMKLISHSIIFIPVPPSWIGICARGSSIVIVERCITDIRESMSLKTVTSVPSFHKGVLTLLVEKKVLPDVFPGKSSGGKHLKFILKVHPPDMQIVPKVFLAPCCLGQVLGGAPFSQRSEQATACTNGM